LRRRRAPVREIAWKAQHRLCGRYRALIRKGKLKTVVVTAIAREHAVKSANQSLITDVSRLRPHRCTMIASNTYRENAARRGCCAFELDMGHQSEMRDHRRST
jgi:hypothetical protein